jgi:hypothetical protein
MTAATINHKSLKCTTILNKKLTVVVVVVVAFRNA